MIMFKIGDRVRCVDNKGAENDLDTVCKVEHHSLSRITVVTNSNFRPFFSKRFVKVGKKEMG